ncbi:hypothetical protein Tco_0218984 [Tanacetum coccineum]
MIVQIIKTYWELGHEHKFITEIVARRANGSIVCIIESNYKNLKKNDIEDMYLLIINHKVRKAINNKSILLHQQSLSQALRSKRCSPSSLNKVLEGLNSYNNDVKYGYVTQNLSKEDVEYLQLFTEKIEERLKYRDQMRRARDSPVITPLHDDPYMLVRQAYTPIAMDTKSEPLEDPIETEETQPPFFRAAPFSPNYILASSDYTLDTPYSNEDSEPIAAAQTRTASP